MIRKKLALFILPFVTAFSLQAGDPFFNDPFGDDIFQEMMQMQREMDRMFERMHQRMRQRSTAMVSPIGTYRITQQSQFVDRGDHYSFQTDIPESKENTINISVSDHILTIEAKVVKTEETNQGGMVSYQRYMSMYQRSLPLPADADENSMKSGYVNGYLTITFQKKGTASQSATPSQKSKKTSEQKPTLLDINGSNKTPVDGHKASMG